MTSSRAPRFAFIAWQSPIDRSIRPVVRLRSAEDEAGGKFEVCYVRGVEHALTVGFDLFPRLQPLDGRWQVRDLRDFPLTGNRLMSPKRPDYADYVHSLGLGTDVEPLLLLARSEGRKQTDNLEVFAPPLLCDDGHRWVYHALLRGVRHVAGAEEAIERLADGDRLTVVADPENDHDGRARKLLSPAGDPLGWIPTVLLHDFDQALRCNSAIGVTAAKINRPPAPVQQRVLLRIEVEAVGAFEPMSGTEYQPLAPDAPPTRVTRDDAGLEDC